MLNIGNEESKNKQSTKKATWDENMRCRVFYVASFILNKIYKGSYSRR